MKRGTLLLFCLMLLTLSTVSAAPYAGTGYSAFRSNPVAPGVVSLNYHNVGKVVNLWDVSPATLDSHFAFIKANGYTPITLNQYIAAMRDGASLPPKALLLTFDDGYESFYTEVFPLLKKYNYPAVMSVITSWIEGYAPPDAGKVLSWQQLREMETSGLVAVASHTHQAHRYVARNPQGDTGTALETRIYQNGRYETLAEYKRRVQADFRQSQTILERELGHKAKALVWPFGGYTLTAIELAEAEGFEVFFRLEGGINTAGQAAIYEARRGIITNNPDTASFARYLQNNGRDTEPMRMAQVDLDFIYDPNPRQLSLNIKLAVERLRQAGANTVFLQAFSDSKGDGNIDSVYFYTNAAPVKANIFSHVASTLQEQGFTVFAWMPSLAGQWLTERHPDAKVTAYAEKGNGWYNRASPFSEDTARELENLFSDLASHSYIRGILFQDDLYLNDYEDFSPAAKAAFRKEFGRELTPDALKDDLLRKRWTEMKTEALNKLTQRLIAATRQSSPQLMTARNIYPIVITEPNSEEWFAQNYRRYLDLYDFTVIMAYPYMEKQSHRSRDWLSALADAALREPGAAAKTVFKLQTYDWERKIWLPDKELKEWQRALTGKGALHFGYYPENIYAED